MANSYSALIEFNKKNKKIKYFLEKIMNCYCEL